MPIIERPQPGSPLSQGDLLKDITLFLTADEWGRAVDDRKSPPITSASSYPGRV
jgi:hypothetical protein